jgi:hypothetical protein
VEAEATQGRRLGEPARAGIAAGLRPASGVESARVVRPDENQEEESERDEDRSQGSERDLPAFAAQQRAAEPCKERG